MPKQIHKGAHQKERSRASKASNVVPRSKSPYKQYLPPTVSENGGICGTSYVENGDEPAQADSFQEQRARHLVRSDLPRQRSVLSPAAGFAWFGCLN